MEQKVEILHDELIITSNGAITNNSGTSANFSGDFIIKAHDLAKLIAIFHKKNLRVAPNYSELSRNFNVYYIGDKEISQIIESIRQEVKDLSKSRNILERELHELQKRIEAFNNSRRWYERKFK